MIGVWVPLLLKCGLKTETGDHRYNFHSLRHAAASLFIAYLKWPPQTHSDRPWARQNQHDDLYGHLFESVEADREDMKKLDGASGVSDKNATKRAKTQIRSMRQGGAPIRCCREHSHRVPRRSLAEYVLSLTRR